MLCEEPGMIHMIFDSPRTCRQTKPVVGVFQSFSLLARARVCHRDSTSTTVPFRSFRIFLCQSEPAITASVHDFGTQPDEVTGQRSRPESHIMEYHGE